MKKVTFSLLALIISGTTFAQSKAFETATVKAEIVSPIALAVNETALSFGRIASTEEGGTVTVTPGSSTATYAGEGLPVAGGIISNPTFTVTAESAYQITFEDEVKLTSGANTMELNDFTTNLTSNSGVTATEFQVGASLAVGVKQAPGKYEGTVKVTVSYE